MKVLETWNRVHRVQWMYPLVADFPRSLPISQSPCYSRAFFTPYESTRDVKPRPMSTMNVPFGCRFSSIVADFSVSLYSRVFFTPYESTRDVKPRPMSTMKVPFVADFPRSLPISQSPCIVGNFSPLMKVLGTWNRVQWVQWKYPLIADFPRSWPISQSPCMVGNFYPLWKYSGRETASTEYNESTPWSPILPQIDTDFSVHLV